ncbi:PI-PLC X domain-containing protein At5g67130 [Nymphaea colorata]|nr:PI-PLC X domain-containing protein At5g67130 [Nymphaea colorata]
MGFPRAIIILLFLVLFPATQSKLLDPCSNDGDCGAGFYCGMCSQGFSGTRCIRDAVSDQFKLLNNSLPFNKYAYLTTHNSYAIAGEPSHTGVQRLTFANQDDTVTQQLKNGVRALMLDTYDFEGDVWLCHSYGGKCYNFTAFERAIDTLREIESFMSANPSEIITLILEDYVHTPNALRKVFNDSGLSKFWFPVSKMPKKGEDWPLVRDMVASNERLLVFTSIASKEQSEGIAYEWNYIVENEYGDAGENGTCTNRPESPPLNDMTKSLVLVNHFPSMPVQGMACSDNSGSLMNVIKTCYAAAGNRWANFLAVDFYKRSEGEGAFGAIDAINGKLLCGSNDVNYCGGSMPVLDPPESAPEPINSANKLGGRTVWSKGLLIVFVILYINHRL